MSIDRLVDRIVEAAIRRAAGLPYSLAGVPDSLSREVAGIVESLASELASRDHTGLTCRLCGRGHFTPTGFLLHVRRVHLDTLRARARAMLEKALIQSAAGSPGGR